MITTLKVLLPLGDCRGETVILDWASDLEELERTPIRDQELATTEWL